ncbi:MAG: cytochrome c oxidase (chain cbb3-type) [Deltaproteobacteria bacterium]|nr:cytochrome c oxidase (chain cbb3-type) [Deltaproteobacteria bacterium]
MTDTTRDVLQEHEFDGIQEYDNPTPGWWYLIFFATFVFSLWYFLYYHMSTISTPVAVEYQDATADDMKKRFAEIGDLKPDAATVVRFMNEPGWLQFGASIFKTNCVSCHAANGQGQVGPNLTDDAYKNVTKIDDIPQVIANGAANGAMPAWKTRMHPNEVVLVASYVASLRGKNLPGPRGAEGTVIPPWPAPPVEPKK